MRLSLKLLIIAVIVIPALYFLPKDYTKKSRDIAVDLDSYLECFGLNRNVLVGESENIYKSFNSKYLLINRTYEVSFDFPFDTFQRELKVILKKKHLNLLNKKDEKGRVECSIEFKRHPLYKIRFLKRKKGYLAIVLDDFGYNNKRFHYFKKIDIPLNISILPELRYSNSASILATASGHEVLLHLPMEPIKKEEIERHLEKCTIKSTASDRDIIAQIDRFLDEMKNIKGVNNHMGSSLCRDKEKMTVVLSALKEHGVYFLDSRVIPNSRGPEIARELGLKCFQRDVFIDNISNEDYIRGQIREAIDLAKRRGFAIAIGHDRENTFKVIVDMLDEIKDETYPIRLSNLK